MHAEVAERFSAFDGRVFLAGDAAHRFPPAGGFGESPLNAYKKEKFSNSGYLPFLKIAVFLQV